MAWLLNLMLYQPTSRCSMCFTCAVTPVSFPDDLFSFPWQAESTGKSQMAIEKMVEGRLRKYYEEVVLMEQKFIVNDALNIKV